MTPDGISFHLTSEALISISQGQVHLLLGSEWHDLTGSNFGNFLLESQSASGLTGSHHGRKPAEPFSKWAHSRVPLVMPPNAYISRPL
jgi:hypothetical protein